MPRRANHYTTAVFRFCTPILASGGSFSECHKTLSGQALKAIYKLNRYLYNFTNITPRHKLELFDKLVTPILNYGSEIWGFTPAKKIERVHMFFCKQLLGVKTSTQNVFINGDLGRTNYYTRRVYIIIKYWLKVVYSDNRKYINQMYRMMLNDITDRQIYTELGIFSQKYVVKSWVS